MVHEVQYEPVANQFRQPRAGQTIWVKEHRCGLHRSLKALCAIRNCERVEVLAAVVDAQPGRGFSAAVYLQLLQKIVDMVFDSGRADRQLPRDLLVGATLAYQRQDLAFALREGRQRAWRLRLVQKAREASEHRRYDMRSAMHQAVRRVDDGTAQRVSPAFARDVT